MIRTASLSFPTPVRFIWGETGRYRDLAKTRLFPTTERVLPPIPDNTDNGLPVYGGAPGGFPVYTLHLNSDAGYAVVPLTLLGAPVSIGSAFGGLMA